MFEDSLMESQNRLSSPNQRWTSLLSLTVQCALVAAIIVLPLFHPETLPFHADAPKVTLALKPVPPPVPHVEETSAASTSAAMAAPGHPLTEPTHIHSLSQMTPETPPAMSPIGSGMSDPNGVAESLANSTSGSGPRISVAPTNLAAKGPLHISTGVLAGLLMAPITPIYPRIAISARVEGAVKIEAIISKSGRIESAHVISGPEMLRQAALEAVRNAHYTPYLLNGLPTEVETTITVNFRLAS